ncbi:MAG: hypothetical protein R3E79_24160 [Caldilineaceae bacterium]
MSQQSSDLNPAETIGLAGLQIYGLFLTTNDWHKGRDLRGIVNDKTLPVADALTALAYHNFIVPTLGGASFGAAVNSSADGMKMRLCG